MSDQMTMPTVGEAQEEKPARKMSIWVIVGIIALLCILLICCVFVALVLLGPAIGNVFSNIIEQVGTPVP